MGITAAWATTSPYQQFRLRTPDASRCRLRQAQDRADPQDPRRRRGNPASHRTVDGKTTGLSRQHAPAAASAARLRRWLRLAFARRQRAPAAPASLPTPQNPRPAWLCANVDLRRPSRSQFLLSPAPPLDFSTHAVGRGYEGGYKCMPGLQSVE